MQPHHIKTIQEFHQLRQLPGPQHPLVSVVRYEDMRQPPTERQQSLVLDFYSIGLKRNFNGKIKYGQQEYDFDEGLMTFMAPGQVFRIEVAGDGPLQHSGRLVLIHPDFLWKTPLARKIRQCQFFDYSVHEALFLSEKEEAVIMAAIDNIEQECNAHIDRFSPDVIMAHIEVLLSYSDRFYHRQFITRKIANHHLLDQLEALLRDYFASDDLAHKGQPTVQYVADALHVSPGYLGEVLRLLTGHSTQHHIQDKLIDKAREKLSATTLSVSEIAYDLGFEHPQSFSKFFKAKTQQSPLEFRKSFG